MGRGRAELEGCARCIQILVLIFNLIFFIFGVALLGYGIYALIQLGDYASFSTTDILTGSKLLIGSGALISVISFLGCCGAWKLNKCLLITFMVLLFIILCVEIAAAVVAYLHKSEVKQKLNKEMTDFFNEYQKPGKESATKTIDTLQKNQKCCGILKPRDWERTPWGAEIKNRFSLPDSCCTDFKKDCGKGAVIAGRVRDGYFKEGCETKLEKYLPVIGGIAIAIVVIQLLGMIFACVLVHGVSKGTYA